MMRGSQTLDIALKEWHVVCRALESGRQIILLRKGGIFEAAGGFELEHPRFLLFPTFVHQNLGMLKPGAHERFEPRADEPARIELRAWCAVTDAVRLESRRQMDALDAEHVWTPPLIDMRFDYRPENPLYLLVVRAHVLSHPVTIENTPAYAGCKSWAPLDDSVHIGQSTSAMSSEAFDGRRARILEAVGGPTKGSGR